MMKMGTNVVIDDVLIRDYNAVADERFIYATWIKSFRDSSFCRAVPAPIYERSQRQRIGNILSRDTTYILIATPKDTPELILGYLVGESPNVIHYLYVKKDYRQLGLTDKLFWFKDGWSADEPILYTHKSADIWVEKKLQESNKLKNFLYDPYQLERTE